MVQSVRETTRNVVPTSMGSETTRAPTGRPPTEPEKPGLDILEVARYLLAAARRHWVLGCVVALIAGALGVFVAATIPSVYESTSKVFDSQSSNITASVAGARREDERDSMRGVREFALSRENLLSIAREVQLLERWQATRIWPLKLKDQLFEALFGPQSDADKELALLKLLERAITVEIEDNSSIRFRVQWRDPRIAYELTTLSQRNLLCRRGEGGVEAVKRGIGLLEQELTRAEAGIDPAVKEVARLLEKARLDAAQQRAARMPVAAPRRTPRAAVASPEPVAPAMPVDIAQKLEDLRREEREMLEPWQRRNAEVKLQLAELRSVYGPEHPQVRQQEAKVAAAAAPPLELSENKAKQAALLASVAAIVRQPEARPPEVHRPVAARPLEQPAQREVASSEREPEAPEIAAARARLDAALGKVRELNDRLDAARIEIASQIAGSGDRYVVVQAAEVANKPVRPKRPLLYAGALLFALLLGLGAGAVRELAGGRLVATWQVRSLGLEVLGEVPLDLTKLSLTRSVPPGESDARSS